MECENVFDAIKRKLALLTGLLVTIVLFQLVVIAGLGAFAYFADARANTAMAEITAIRSELGEAKDASETARDYGRMAAALGPPCPAEEPRPPARRHG